MMLVKKPLRWCPYMLDLDQSQISHAHEIKAQEAAPFLSQRYSSQRAYAGRSVCPLLSECRGSCSLPISKRGHVLKAVCRVRRPWNRLDPSLRSAREPVLTQ